MNVDLDFDDVWADGRYALWVRQLKNLSGVYVIRSTVNDQILYVGESHEDRLYQTLTRHFQQWNDRHEIDPLGGRRGGPTYDRHRVDVAAHVCAGRLAVERQYEFIRALNPRDNLVTGASLEEEDEEEDLEEEAEEDLEDEEPGDEDEDGDTPF